MSRVNVAEGQEVVKEDLNKMSSLLQNELYDRVILELMQRAVDGFFQDSFLVTFVSSLTVSVNKGLGFQEDLTVAPEEPTLRPIYQAASVNQTISPADGVNDRIDIITVKHNLADGNTDTRKFKAASGGAITNEIFVIDKDWSVTYNVIAGTPAGSPSAPAVPAGEIQICELLIHAVSGLGSGVDVTDSRSLLPIGGASTIDTTGVTRLTASASVTIDQLMDEIDAFLVSGLQEFTDMVDQVSDPSAPAVNRLRLYNKGDLLFVRNNGGDVTPVGSGGGGGGGGANWVGDALEAEEFSEKVLQFAQSDSQKMTLYIKVPQGYLAGRQILMFLGIYSSDTADEVRMQTVTSLVRKDQDAINSSANQHTANSGDLILTSPANEYRQSQLALTTAIGQINAFAVSPGDILRVELSREAPGGSEATSDVKFIPSSTEVKFG